MLEVDGADRVPVAHVLLCRVGWVSLALSTAAVIGTSGLIALYTFATADADISLLLRGKHKRDAFVGKVVWVTGASQVRGFFVELQQQRCGASNLPALPTPQPMMPTPQPMMLHSLNILHPVMNHTPHPTLMLMYLLCFVCFVCAGAGLPSCQVSGPARCQGHNLSQERRQASGTDAACCSNRVTDGTTVSNT